MPNTFLLGRLPWSNVLVVIGLNPLEDAREEVRPESRPVLVTEDPKDKDEPTGTLATSSLLTVTGDLGLVMTPPTGDP